MSDNELADLKEQLRVCNRFRDRYTEETNRLRAVLREAVLQIEDLHEKFGETGSGNAVINRARLLLPSD